MQNTFSQSGNDSKCFLKKSFFRIGMWNSRPGPLHGKKHLKFPFWLFDYPPKKEHRDKCDRKDKINLTETWTFREKLMILWIYLGCIQFGQPVPVAAFCRVCQSIHWVSCVAPPTLEIEIVMCASGTNILFSNENDIFSTKAYHPSIQHFSQKLIKLYSSSNCCNCNCFSSVKQFE